MSHDLTTGDVATGLCHWTTRTTATAATFAHVTNERYHCQVHLPLCDALAQPSQPLTWPCVELLGTDCICQN